MDKKIFKKTQEELEEYLHFKKRGFTLPMKKGKGSYRRKDKHPKRDERNDEYEVELLCLN